MILYYGMKLLRKVVCTMPLSLRRVLGNILGEFSWLLIPQRRKRMAVNNIVCSLEATPEQAQIIAKASAVRFGRMFMEVLHFPKLNKDNIEDYATITGVEHLHSALAYGRGGVIITAHSGNWEALGAALCMRDLPVVVIAQKQSNVAMDKFINENRASAKIRIAYKNNVREMIKVLGEGKFVGVLMDQDADNDGVFVEFFGRPASTAQGAAYLARSKNAPIIPAFITERSDGTHHVIVHPPVWVETTNDRENDLLVTTQKLNRIIEDHIRTYPHEWFWLHNRWKHQPK